MSFRVLSNPTHSVSLCSQASAFLGCFNKDSTHPCRFKPFLLVFSKDSCGRAPLENHGIGAGFPVGWDGPYTMQVLIETRVVPQDPAPGKGDPLQCQGVEASSVEML